MFIHAIMGQRLAAQPKKWNHEVNRNSPIVSLAIKTPACTLAERHNSVYLRADNISCFFMIHHTIEGVIFHYDLEIFHATGFAQEKGEFFNFDSVSVVFGGLRFHWCRGSEKIIISDALAGRRDFEALTIE